jgi:hypothetical protein
MIGLNAQLADRANISASLWDGQRLHLRTSIAQTTNVQTANAQVKMSF